ncbi:MAG: SET domain-containing protein [Candidatus Hodarchaeota archaeon]
MKENSKVSVRMSSIHGKGVFANHKIRKGERILEIDDSRVVDDENPLNPNYKDDHHCDYLANGKVVLMQPPERYINHSCNPNVFALLIDNKRYIYARRDISVGEELTFDYCIDSGGDVVWECNCGSPRCRKTIHSDFFHLPLDLQFEYFPLLSEWFIEENKEKIEELRYKMSISTS